MPPSAARERYIVVDVETDGPIPGPHSLLSLGAVACDPAGHELDAWYANFETLPGAAPHPDTQAFWDRHPEAYAATRARPVLPPEEAMQRFALWVRKSTGGSRHRAVLVAAPAGFDAMWVHWYEWRFLGEAPTRRTSVDLKALAMGLNGGSWHPALQAYRPPPAPNTRAHHALDDARRHAAIFRQLRAAAPTGLDATAGPATS